MSADALDRVARERREADARYNDALTALDRALEPIAELRTQIGVLQRRTDALTRGMEQAQESQVPTKSPVPSPQPLASTSDITYVSFEDAFRGSDETIHERLRAYVPIFTGTSDVLDVGCGRGEFLHALKSAGIAARGVDANGEMAAIARERGLDAAHGDALGYLTACPDASLGGLVATQVVEHLEPAYLMQLLATASQKLRPGAPIVLETINAACWLAFFSSYIRDLTHVRPVHPDTLQYLLRASGFERVEVRYSAPVPEHVKMKTIDLPAGVLSSNDAASVALSRVAHTLNANAVVLNSLMFTHMDYAAIGYRG